MNRTAIDLIIVLLGFLIAAECAWAQAPLVRLTLPDAIARGLEASHRLAEFGARQEAARAVEDQRKAAELPRLALQAG
jgi:outer membrane protein TolC